MFLEAQLNHRRRCIVLGKGSTTPSSRRAPLPSLAQERPGDMHGMPGQNRRVPVLLPTPEHRRLQSGSEVPPGRGRGHHLPARRSENARVQGALAVVARTVSSMLTVVLVAVGLEPGDGKLETLIPKPWACRCEASSRAPIYFYFTYYSVDLQCIHYK